MERKTKVNAGSGKQDIVITREFDLPLELLFRAYTEADIVEQWMNTKVVKLESKKHGGWHFQTSDGNGNIVFEAHGVHHEFIPEQKITRTFQMVNTPFDVTLEFITFEKLTDDTSKITIHIIYRTPELRDEQLKLPFEWGLNMAHNQLEKILTNLK